MGAAGRFLRGFGGGGQTRASLRLSDKGRRHIHLKAERPDLQDVGVMQVPFADSLAIDAGAHATIAVANVQAVGSSRDNAVNAGNFRGIQLDVTTAGLSERD